MASVKFKALEAGRSYNALIWHTSSQKEPVEVNIVNYINEGTGIRVVTDKFDVVQEGGQVIHSETGKRVTFRTLGDTPLFTPSTPKASKPKREDTGWNIPPAGAIINPTRSDKIKPMLPAPDTAYDTQHVLMTPGGLETCWIWTEDGWKLGLHSEGKPGKFMALAGYSYIRPAKEGEYPR